MGLLDAPLESSLPDLHERAPGVVRSQVLVVVVRGILERARLALDDVDELFAWFDPDNSGTIEFGELNTLLRRGQTIEVDGLALQSAPRVRQPGGLISHGKTTLGFERGRTQLRERAEHGSVLGGRDVLTEARDYAEIVATLRARLATTAGSWLRALGTREHRPVGESE